jgi:hypothetical protein
MGAFLADRYRQLIAAFLISAAVIGFLQFSSPGFAGNDGYYHIAMGSMVWQQGLHVSFPYLEFTLLDQQHYVDTHMLFHLLQAPFTAVFELETAARASSTVFVALAFTLFVWLLGKYEIAFPLFWLLLLLILSESFLYRMLMPRPPVFALAFTWVAFHFLMQRRLTALAITSCLFVWSYKSFPILIAMGGIAVFVFFIEKKIVDLKPLTVIFVGIAIGMVINPYFPDNIYFLWDALRMKIFSDGFNAHVGNEWYPFKTLTLLKEATIPLAAYLGGILLTNREEWKTDPCRLFWFLLSTLWLIMLFKSRRFIEFFPPAALLFFIFSLQPWLRQFSFRKALRHRFGWLMLSAGALALSAAGCHTISMEYNSMQKRAAVDQYRGGATWLKENTPAASTVFHTDWDDFPRLLYCRTGS